MVTKQEIKDYIFHTIGNTNPAILDQMLNEFGQGTIVKEDERDLIERYTLEIVADWEKFIAYLKGSDVNYIKTNLPEILVVPEMINPSENNSEENSPENMFYGFLDVHENGSIIYKDDHGGTVSFWSEEGGNFVNISYGHLIFKEEENGNYMLLAPSEDPNL